MNIDWEAVEKIELEEKRKRLKELNSLIEKVKEIIEDCLIGEEIEEGDDWVYYPDYEYIPLKESAARELKNMLDEF